MKKLTKLLGSVPPKPRSLVAIFRTEALRLGKIKVPEAQMLSQSLHNLANEMLKSREQFAKRATYDRATKALREELAHREALRFAFGDHGQG